MIKVQDFAKECGITDRQVQRLIKKYEAELEGHFDRKGANGTWLSEEACQILRSKMKQQPVVLGDSEIYRRVADLEKENKLLNSELKDAYKDQTALLLQISELQQLRIEAQNTALALEASNREIEQLRQLANKRLMDIQEAQGRADQLHQQNIELEKEMNRPLTLKERFRGRRERP